MNPNRILIFSGGRLGPWALEHIKEGDMLIGADSGALFLVSHGIRPDVALGDFDSVTPAQLELIRRGSGETIDCDPVDKDYTDTELAWNFALTRNPRHIMLLGALGTRFDHSLANVHLLRRALEQGVEAVIADDHNRIRLTSGQLTVEAGDFPYVSLLPLSESVKGITLTGFRYPLEEATLAIGQSLGISNRLQGGEATVRIREGLLLVIQSRD